MKLIDRLLFQAKEILTAKYFDYDTNEDSFIEALGVDQDKYRIEYPNGEFGYDALKALGDIAAEIWKDENN